VQYPELEFLPVHDESHLPAKDICPIPPNGDVAGIGVRYSVYIVQFVNLAFSSFNPRLAAERRTQAQIFSLSIISVTVVCSALKMVSLPHVLIAIGMTSVSIWPAFVVDPLRDASPQSLLLAKCRFLMYSIVCLWINVTPTCFGSDYQCNFATMRFLIGLARGYMAITPASRIRWLRFYFSQFAIGGFRFFLPPGPRFYLDATRAAWSEGDSREWTKAETHVRQTELWHWSKMAGRWPTIFRKTWRVLTTWLFDDSPAPRLPWGKGWRGRAVAFTTNHNLVRFLAGCTVLVMLCADTEALVHGNLPSEENSDFGFGQFVAIATAAEALGALLCWLVWRWKEEEEEVEEWVEMGTVGTRVGL
jgi:hypothetical protein